MPECDQRRYCGNNCGVNEYLGLRRMLFECRKLAIRFLIECRSGVLRKVFGTVPGGLLERIAPDRQPIAMTWWWMPQCRSFRCTYGQSASDEQMVASLSYLRALVDEEDQGLTWPMVGNLATRIARAHLARIGRSLPEMTDIPYEPEATAETVFRRSWPWYLPGAEYTGEVVLSSERFWCPLNQYYFEPNPELPF